MGSLLKNHRGDMMFDPSFKIAPFIDFSGDQGSPLSVSSLTKSYHPYSLTYTGGGRSACLDGNGDGLVFLFFQWRGGLRGRGDGCGKVRSTHRYSDLYLVAFGRSL